MANEAKREWLDNPAKHKPITFEIVMLSKDHEKFWVQTRAKFLGEAPGFAHVLYQMSDPGDRYPDRAIFTKDVPIAATDGRFLLLNPETFFKYPLRQRVFIVGHEVCHNILNHMVTAYGFEKRGKVVYNDGTELPYVNECLQWAMDYVINDMLVESGIGECPPDALHDPAKIKHNMSVIDAYRIVYKEQQKSGGKSSPKGKSGGEGKSFDQHLKPGTTDKVHAEVAKEQRSEQEWKQAVQAGMMQAQMQGKLPGAMKSMFMDVLEPAVSWQDHIEGFFARHVGSGSWNWRRPDRRLIVRKETIYAPSQSGHGAECVVVAADTSGSINNPTLDRFFAELRGILEDVRPKRLVLIWCDAIVHRVDELEDAQDLGTVRAKEAPGRGGTDFRPVFREIEHMGLDPDALVYLTDGQGAFPEASPRYPVLWGSIYPASKYPFGEVIQVPVQVEKRAA